MPTTCHWTNNNLACINTWAFLRALEELEPAFKDAGDLTMRELAWWNPADSAPVRRLAAEALAAQLDQMFAVGLRAKYEAAYTRSQAVAVMADALVQPEVTVCELSVTVDEAYQFTGEKV
jgi:D-alanyl-D-alanine dipeptidase